MDRLVGRVRGRDEAHVGGHECQKGRAQGTRQFFTPLGVTLCEETRTAGGEEDGPDGPGLGRSRPDIGAAGRTWSCPRSRDGRRRREGGGGGERWVEGVPGEARGRW